MWLSISLPQGNICCCMSPLLDLTLHKIFLFSVSFILQWCSLFSLVLYDLISNALHALPIVTCSFLLGFSFSCHFVTVSPAIWPANFPLTFSTFLIVASCTLERSDYILLSGLGFKFFFHQDYIFLFLLLILCSCCSSHQEGNNQIFIDHHESYN